MRPTDLGFRSPREVSQSPFYNPNVTCKGQNIAINRPTHKRSKSSQAIRFFDPKDAVQTTNILLAQEDIVTTIILFHMPLKPKSVQTTYQTPCIASSHHILIERRHYRYKSGPYTYVGGSKVLDLGFVSPQNKKKLPTTVLTTSINLASSQTSKGTPVGSSTESINFSFNKVQSSSELPSKRKSHHRTSSMTSQSAQTVHTVQTSVGRRTPLDRALTSTNPLLTDLSGKKITEGPRVSYNQKQKNDDVYNSYLDLQLSSDLRSIKQDLENFQKRKTVTASGETSKLCSRSGSIHIGSLINAMEQQAATIAAPPIRIKEELKKRNNTEEDEIEVFVQYKKPVLECSEEEEREEDTIGTEIPEEGKEVIYYKQAARVQKNEQSKVLKDNVNYAQYFKSLEGSLHYDDSQSYEAKRPVQKSQHIETYTVKEPIKEVFICKERQQKVEKATTGNRLAAVKKRTLSGTKETFGLKPPGPGSYYTHSLSYGITGSKGKSSLYGLRKI